MQDPSRELVIPVGVAPQSSAHAAIPMVETKSKVTVKDKETITWDFSTDWVIQFELQLTSYLNNPRYKFRSHKTFAQNLYNLLQAAQKDLDKESRPAAAQGNQNLEQISKAAGKTLNLEPILKELREKNGLSPFGRKTSSWLYKFCEVALNQYHLTKVSISLTETLSEKFKSENDSLKKDKEKRDEDVEKLRKSFEERLAERNKDYDRLFKESKDDYGILQKKYQELEKEHGATKQKLADAESREVDLTDQNKQLHAKNGLLVSEVGVLKDQVQSLKNTINEEGQQHSAILIKIKGQLAQATGEITNATQNYAKITAELALERTKNADLGNILAEANSKYHEVSRYYSLMKTWVDKLFGKAFGDLPSTIIEKGKMPFLSQKKELELQEIVANKDVVSEKDEKSDQTPEKNNTTFGKFFEDAKKRTQDAVQGAVTVTTEKLQSYTGSGPKT